MAKKKELSFEEAYEQLSKINQQLQDGEIGIDKMSETVKQALDLVQYCKQKLRSIDEQLEQIVSQEIVE